FCFLKLPLLRGTAVLNMVAKWRASPSPSGRRWPEGPDEGPFSPSLAATRHPLPEGEGPHGNRVPFWNEGRNPHPALVSRRLLKRNLDSCALEEGRPTRANDGTLPQEIGAAGEVKPILQHASDLPPLRRFLANRMPD